ncbi:JmjC domain, hydroxylase-domain-containing protein [Immersiella caudata]|uniref:JmjC domain, hydroxylase-domain-containing protein n=1 Tax=Immersiella caudata TaxID=314043 RepID=A0AA39X4U2_9PEZI|nr:JmjC domain, hydroxylase-domain-containing protein [Immersiella caudata]
MHSEDFDMPTVNVHHLGKPKLWFVVPAGEREKLLAALSRDKLAVRRQGSCHQFLRHASLFIHPKYLDEKSVKFTCFLQGPGVAVLVLPGAIHYGFNLGTNIAEANNYVPTGWEPPKLKECKCSGQNPITRKMLVPPTISPTKQRTALKRAATICQQTRKRPKLCRNSDEQPNEDAPVSQWLRYISSFEPLTPPDAITRAPRIFRHILALWSRRSIVRICEAIKFWGSNYSMKQLSEGWKAGSRLQRLLCPLEPAAHLSGMIDTIFGILVCNEIAHKHEYNGRLEHKTEFNIEPGDKFTHDRAYRRYRNLRTLNSLCVEGVGLLFAIPATKEAPFHISINDYIKLSKTDVSHFRGLVMSSDVFRKAYQMADKFADCVRDGKDMRVYNWEHLTDLTALERASEEEVLKYLEPEDDSEEE